MTEHTFTFTLSKKTKQFYRYDEAGWDEKEEKFVQLKKEDAVCNFGKLYIPHNLFTGADIIQVTVKEVEHAEG